MHRVYYHRLNIHRVYYHRLNIHRVHYHRLNIHRVYYYTGSIRIPDQKQRYQFEQHFLRELYQIDFLLCFSVIHKIIVLRTTVYTYKIYFLPEITCDICIIFTLIGLNYFFFNPGLSQLT